MRPQFASSGDLIADRRYDRARDFEARGDLVAAADVLVQALERAPGFAAAWFALGEVREKARDQPGAIAAFRQALTLDRDDRLGAALRLVRLGVEPAGEPMSKSYVRALFDQYAPSFDSTLVAGLHYRGPQLLRDAVENVAGRDARFERAVDLGCGTGLAGVAFRPLCRTLIGVDLSAEMIARARAKGIYDELITADLTEWLDREPGGTADLVIAADSFVYLPGLGPVCITAARVLAPGGLIAFTVETHRGADVVLGEKLRYAHGADHVRAALDGAGLAPVVLANASTRTENAVPVAGLVVVARQP